MFLQVTMCCDTAQALVFLQVTRCCDTAQALVFLLLTIYYNNGGRVTLLAKVEALLYLKGTWSEEASRTLYEGMKYTQQISLELRSYLLKIDVWKSRKHDLEHCHFVPSCLRLWRHEQGRHVWNKVSKTSRSNLFKLFTGKERTNMAAPQRVKIIIK